MEKDNAVRNQKVYVSLHAVLELQANLHRLIMNASASKGTGALAPSAYAQGFASAIKMLQLPIDIPQGY